MTVRRVIYTSSVVAASPVNEDYTGFKCSVDESCWTPLDVDHPHRSAELCYNGERFHGLSEPVVHHPIALQEYIQSKLLPEKELLGYNAGESPAFEVVTLPLAAVGGDTLLEHAAPLSMDCLASPVSRNGRGLWVLTTMQRLLGSVPVAHIDDVCDALVFCMERPSMTGRFICSAAYPTLAEIVDHFAGKYPHLDLIKETEELPSLQSHSDRLGELGFKYKHGIEEILDGSVECAVRFGWLDASKLSLQG
uniref:NAD-dependent epimerase/dehydratase domain-containing protein n=2 Tax=Oryza brachyantha TaxID=4533 RepID=J3MGC7_ORYBR